MRIFRVDDNNHEKLMIDTAAAHGNLRRHEVRSTRLGGTRLGCERVVNAIEAGCSCYWCAVGHYRRRRNFYED